MRNADAAPAAQSCSRPSDDERDDRHGGHKLVSLPLAMTGPVGWPVGDAARRLERYRERRVRRELAGEFWRNGEPDRLTGLDQAERMRALVGSGQDQPKLHGARIVGQQRGRHDDQAVAGRGDGGDEVRLARCCRRASPSTAAASAGNEPDIGQRGDAGGRERGRADAEAAPERDALPQRRSGSGDGGRPTAMAASICDHAWRRWHDRRDGVGDPAQPLLPERHLGRKRRLLREASLDLAPLLARRARPARIRRQSRLPPAAGSMVSSVLMPRDRLSSFSSPRRIQLFMVPSGTLMRAASSS